MNEAVFRFIGKPIPRKEDERLITGKGRFSDDFRLDGQAYAAMVRSPHPHARILRRRRRRAPRRCRACSACSPAPTARPTASAPIPHDPLPKTRYDMKLHGPGGGEVFIGPHMLLPADKARHVGEAVAMVVAETPPQALDAAEAVEVDYEELPFVLHSEDAMRPGAPAVWDEVPGQRPGRHAVRRCRGDRQGLRGRRPRRRHGLPYRPRHRRADGAARRASAITTPPPAATRSMPARAARCARSASSPAILGIEPDTLRVLSYDVGGNFGTRNRVFVEFGLVLWASRKLGRPVKYTATALGGLPQRLPGPRPRHQGRAGAALGRPLPRHARHQYQQCRRALRVALAARARAPA